MTSHEIDSSRRDRWAESEPRTKRCFIRSSQSLENCARLLEVSAKSLDDSRELYVMLSSAFEGLDSFTQAVLSSPTRGQSHTVTRTPAFHGWGNADCSVYVLAHYRAASPIQQKAIL